MILPNDIFLALRYLRPKRTFISVITLLSIMGPALGVAILIVVTSLMSGFDRDIRQRILDTQAHVTVRPAFEQHYESIPTVSEPERVVEAMQDAGMTGAPLIEGPVLLQYRESIAVKYLRGIMPEQEMNVSAVPDYTRGVFDIAPGQALLGEAVAAELGVGIGDKLLVHSPQKLTRNIKWDDEGRIELEDPDQVYLPEEVTVAGVFAMGLYDFDSSIVLLHIDQAAELMGLDWGSATSVHGRTAHPFQMQKETQELRTALPAYRVMTWQEANRQLFGALRVEKNLMLLVLSMIVVVAGFCIAGTLVTVVINKTREIAVLKAVGMGGMAVARIFILQGAIIGLLGTLTGMVLGLLVVHFRNQLAGLLAAVMGVEIFPKELYHLSQIPGMVKPADVALIIVIAFFICIGASLLPALYASALSPARALQDEN